MSIETLPLTKGEDAFAWFNNYSEITTMIQDIVSCAVRASAPGVLPQSGLGIVPLVTPSAVVLYHAPTAVCKMFVEFVAKGASNSRRTIMRQNKPVKWF